MRHKKGLGLPMVMVLIVLSQIMYLSLVKQQQVELNRYRLFKQYYLSQVAFRIAEQDYVYLPSDLAGFLEERIGNQVQMALDKVARWIPGDGTTILNKDKQVDILPLETASGSPQYLAYQTQIFVSEDQAEACKFLTTYQCTGTIDTHGGIRTFEQWVNPLDKLEKEGVLLGYLKKPQSVVQNMKPYLLGVKTTAPQVFDQGRIEVKSQLQMNQVQLNFFDNAGNYITNKVYPMQTVRIQVVVLPYLYQRSEK